MFLIGNVDDADRDIVPCFAVDTIKIYCNTLRSLYPASLEAFGSLHEQYTLSLKGHIWTRFQFMLSQYVYATLWYIRDDG